MITKDGLSRSQTEFFSENGYLVLPDFIDAQACLQLRDRAMYLAETLCPTPQEATVFTADGTAEHATDNYFLSSGDKIRCFFEKDAFTADGKLKNTIELSLNKIGHALHDLDPVYNKFSRSPQMKHLAADLQMADALMIQSMHIFKHASIGGVVDVHQDSSFLYTEPGSCVGFWFALEDATIQNGCMWAKPGGHVTTLRSWFRRQDSGGTEFKILDTSPIDMTEMIPLEVKKGACIVLDGLLPHYSLHNKSQRSRQAYAVHTISPLAHYPVQNWLRRDITSLSRI